MTPDQERDSLPHSEVAATPGNQASPGGLPSWKRCDLHRVSFLFECRLCSGAILGYGH